MAISDRPKSPGALGDLAVGFVVVAAVHGNVVAVHIAVFTVDVVNGIAQLANGSNRVYAIPEKVARIQVCAHRRAGCRAHPQHGLNVVDQHAGVDLDPDLDAMIAGEGFRFFPVRDGDIIPLIVEDLQKVRRPGAGDPVWRAVTGAARWQS